MTTIAMMPGHTLEEWGLIPSFLDENDPRPAKEQFNERYQGGWNPFPGFTRGPNDTLLYPRDPPIHPLGIIFFRNEVIVLYEYEWVLIGQPDGSFEVAHMD
jgi:hypothetical protein